MKYITLCVQDGWEFQLKKTVHYSFVAFIRSPLPERRVESETGHTVDEAIYRLERRLESIHG